MGVAEEDIVSSSGEIIIPVSVNTDSDDNDPEHPTVPDKYLNSNVKKEIEEVYPMSHMETKLATQILGVGLNNMSDNTHAYDDCTRYQKGRVEW